MIRINLVPSEYMARQRAKVQAARLAAVGAFGVMLVLLVSLLHVKSTFDAEKTLKEKQRLLQTYQDKVSKVRDLEAAKAAVEGHLNAIDMLLNGRLYYTNFIKDLLQSMSSTVWFSTLNTTVQPATGNIDFNVNAGARSADDFAVWYSRLDAPGGAFSAPKLNGGLSINKDSQSAYTYSFSVSCLYKQPKK